MGTVNRYGIFIWGSGFGIQADPSPKSWGVGDNTLAVLGVLVAIGNHLDRLHNGVLYLGMTGTVPQLSLLFD